MRDIRFRAWDGKNMFYNWINLAVVGTNFELMQFTGLIDKKGKEIYEGDIVQVKKDDWWRPSIEFGWSKDDEYGWLMNYKGQKHLITGVDRVAERFEVIGNIYENPDLLEAKS